MAFSFGAPAQQQQQPAAGGNTGGFSFGQPAGQQQGTSTGGGFSFGGQQQQQQQQQQPNQPGQQQQPSTGGFSFGQPQQQQQQNQQQQQPQPQQQSGGLFGSSTTGGASGFGSSTNAGGGGLFGQQQAQSKPAFSFGGSTTTTQQPQQQQQPGQAGQAGQAGQLGQSQFGQSQLGQSQFGASQAQQSQQQQQPQQDKKLGQSLTSKMEAIRQAWDTNNLQTCRFMTYFYNSLPPGVLPPTGPTGAGGGGPFDSNPNFGRRQDAVGPYHDALWQSAVTSNPDPTALVPVLAVGFPDLKARVEGQEKEAARQLEHLAQLRGRIEAAERRETLSDSVRAKAALKRQQGLHHRIMGIARKSHVLVPPPAGQSSASASLSASRGGAGGSGSITKEEEALRARLEACEADLEQALSGSVSSASSSSSSATKLKSRINDLWTTLATIKAQRTALERSGRRPGGVEWAVVDPKGVEDVAGILAQQQAGLNHLVATLEEDARALDTVCRGLKGVELVGVEGQRRGAR